MGHQHQAESPQNFTNRLKEVRLARGFSQGELAAKSGITRQAVSSIESLLYLPTTAVALRLASVLACRVEDLFSLAQSDEVIEGMFLGSPPQHDPKVAPYG
jgi:putative molybdopterin biosynthesis protein